MKPDAEKEIRPENRQAGNSAAARGETGTHTDELPRPLGSAGTSGSDLGGIPRTLDSGPAAQGLGQDSAEADMTIDAGPGRQAASQTGRADAAAGSAEPQAEKPEEQLARPTKDGTATQRDINDA